MILQNIEKNRILHDYASGSGSAGGPLLSSKAHKVIGIHMGCLMEPKHRNIGSLLSQALSEFLNNYLK